MTSARTLSLADHEKVAQIADRRPRLSRRISLERGHWPRSHRVKPGGDSRLPPRWVHPLRSRVVQPCLASVVSLHGENQLSKSLSGLIGLPWEHPGSDQKNAHPWATPIRQLVGVGFEPTTSRLWASRATGLLYPTLSSSRLGRGFKCLSKQTFPPPSPCGKAFRRT